MISAPKHSMPGLCILLALSLISSPALPAHSEPKQSPALPSLLAPSRLPGVVVGNNGTYLESVSWQTSNATAFPNPFTDHTLLSVVKEAVLLVTMVSGSNVTDLETLDFVNGTSSPAYGENVDVATQHLCFTSPRNPTSTYCSLGDPRIPSSFIASGLQAGDPIGSNPLVTLNGTVTRWTLGTPRSVAFYYLTVVDSSSYCLYIEGTPCPAKTILSMSWDQSSGMMIDDSILEEYSSAWGYAFGRFSLEMTSTNLWPPPAPPTTASVSCNPDTILVGEFTICTVTVTPAPPSTNLPVSTSSPSGWFYLYWPTNAGPYPYSQDGMCTLTDGKCTLTYADTSEHNATIIIREEGYPGGPSTLANFTLRIIRPSNVLGVDITSDTIHWGLASAYHTHNGKWLALNVNGSSAPNNTPVFFSSKELSSPDPSVTSTGNGQLRGLSGVKYYDLAIRGISTGSARVCIEYPGAGTATLLRYWAGAANGSWLNATSIAIEKTTDTTVCGNIPVSELTGTNIAVGNIPSTPLLSNSLLIAIAVAVAITIATVFAIAALRRRKTTNSPATQTPPPVLAP